MLQLRYSWNGKLLFTRFSRNFPHVEDQYLLADGTLLKHTNDKITQAFEGVNVFNIELSECTKQND